MKLTIGFIAINGVLLATEELSDVSCDAGASLTLDLSDRAADLARTSHINIKFDDILQGSEGAIQAYRKSWSRELAEDQFRRGVDAAGAWDETVTRCNQLNLSQGVTCTLRHGHDGLHENRDLHDSTKIVHAWGATAAQQAAAAAEHDRLHGLAAADDRNCG